MAGFPGFSKDTPKFLRGLSKNNNKKWFDAHRDDYEAHYLEPAKVLVSALGERVARIAPNVSAEPRVNGSIFRVNRDIRFTTDKTPYKDHIDIWLWEGPDRKTATSGFYLRIRANGIEIGAGAHHFDKPLLDAYRKRLRNPRTAAALERAVAKVERAGFPVQGEHYKRLPRGVEAGSPAQERLLRHNALWCGGSEKLPTEFYSHAFVGYCVGTWKKLLPVQRWLADELG